MSNIQIKTCAIVGPSIVQMLPDVTSSIRVTNPYPKQTGFSGPDCERPAATLRFGERGQHLAITDMVSRAAGMSQAEDVTFR